MQNMPVWMNMGKKNAKGNAWQHVQHNMHDRKQNMSQNNFKICIICRVCGIICKKLLCANMQEKSRKTCRKLRNICTVSCSYICKQLRQIWKKKCKCIGDHRVRSKACVLKQCQSSFLFRMLGFRMASAQSPAAAADLDRHAGHGTWRLSDRQARRRGCRQARRRGWPWRSQWQC